MLDFIYSLTDTQLILLIVAISLIMIIVNLVIYLVKRNKEQSKNNMSRSKHKKQKGKKVKKIKESKELKNDMIKSKTSSSNDVKEIEGNEEEAISFRNLFEQQQEDNSVISYQELLVRAKNENVSDNDIRVLDAIDDRLILELERNSIYDFKEEDFKIEEDPLEIDVPVVNNYFNENYLDLLNDESIDEEEQFVNDFNDKLSSISQTSNVDPIFEEFNPLQETETSVINDLNDDVNDLENKTVFNSKKSFQASPFISPIYGFNDLKHKEDLSQSKQNLINDIEFHNDIIMEEEVLETKTSKLEDLVNKIDNVDVDLTSTIDNIKNLREEVEHNNIEIKDFRTKIDDLDKTLEFNFDAIPDFHKIKKSKIDAVNIDVDSIRNELNYNKEFLNDLKQFRETLNKNQTKSR